jgi:hypothetical protein
MPSPTLQAGGTVLAKLPPTERHTPFLLLSPEHGVLRVHQRLSSKPGHVHLDLFDEARVELQSPSADISRPDERLWFVRGEPLIVLRRAELGRDYATLLHASEFAGLIFRNPPHAEGRARVHRELGAVLEAFATSRRPDVIHFKAVYRFARGEGHPVREQWLAGLASGLRRSATVILGTPAGEQEPEAREVAELHEALLGYLREHTELLAG